MRAANRVFVLVSVVVGVAAACGAPSPTPNPVASPSPQAAAIASPGPIMTAGPTDAPAASVGPSDVRVPSVSPVASSTATMIAGTIAATVADRVRVRSQPRTGDDSVKYEPLLPLGTKLFVLDRPVSASGYVWYEIAPLTSRTAPTGWVASAGPDGQPWIVPSTFGCPAVPTEFQSLAAMPPAVGLACFPRVPITFEARVVVCECHIYAVSFTPPWFDLNLREDLLVEPSATSAPSDSAEWFALNLDPAGEHPDVLPVGKVVRITGIFDHPAAATCTEIKEPESPNSRPAASQSCRLKFAVTSLAVPS